MTERRINFDAKIAPSDKQAGLTTGHLKPNPAPKPTTSPAKPKK